MKNRKATFGVYKSKRNSNQQISISKSLYKKIMKYQHELIKNKHFDDKLIYNFRDYYKTIFVRGLTIIKN